MPLLTRTQAICCGLFLCGGAVSLGYAIFAEPLEVVPLSDGFHSHAFVRGVSTADELSRTGWAEEFAFHLCDAKRQGLNLEKAMTYAESRSLQTKRAAEYPLELRLKVYAIAAERQCGA